MNHPSIQKIRPFLECAEPSKRVLLAGFLLFMMAACTTSGPKMAGQWEIQEEDKSYIATLDPQGNGTYTWKKGIIKTTECIDGRWTGTWHQAGNDREGGFEVQLTEDGKQAEGVWWYTRMGDHEDIPPKKFGGDYLWVRLPAQSTDSKEK